MDKHFPEQPEGGNSPQWPELEDQELADEHKDMLKELLRIDERTFWEERNLARNLKEDPSLAPSIYFGFLLLLRSRGLLQKQEVADRFDALTKDITGEGRVNVRELASSILGVRKYLLGLGCTEEELSGKEVLRRVMFAELHPKESGWMQVLEEFKKDQGIDALKKIAGESPGFLEALESFDREARKREGR